MNEEKEVNDEASLKKAILARTSLKGTAHSSSVLKLLDDEAEVRSHLEHGDSTYKE